MNIIRNLVVAVLMTIVTTVLLGACLSARRYGVSRRSCFPIRQTDS